MKAENFLVKSTKVIQSQQQEYRWKNGSAQLIGIIDNLEYKWPKFSGFKMQIGRMDLKTGTIYFLLARNTPHQQKCTQKVKGGKEIFYAN